MKTNARCSHKPLNGIPGHQDDARVYCHRFAGLRVSFRALILIEGRLLWSIFKIIFPETNPSKSTMIIQIEYLKLDIFFLK